MQDTMDIHDKVIHLSTINTNENLVQYEDPYDSENYESKEGIKDNSEIAFEDMEDLGSIVEVISEKDEREEPEDSVNSQTKKNLFSGHDSLLRDIISHTPRGLQENVDKEGTTNPNYFNEEMKENNSDAATKKRVEMSNQVGTITPVSSSSSQFFQNNSSFQRFSLLQFNNMMESKDFGVLIQLSEKAIRYREKTENKIITKMIQSQRYSPRMILNRRVQLETWVSKEKEEMIRTKDNLLAKWKQTKEILEQTEENARIIKQQLGNADSRRKTSLNLASPKSEHYSNSLILQSYREECKTEKKSNDEDDETKVIYFSEPQRLIHSGSDNFCGKNSNSAISLRISVLSNRSQEIDLNYRPICSNKLQRTRELKKLPSLMSTEIKKNRQNNSETFRVGTIFKHLLDVTDSEQAFEVKEDIQQVKPKIFEYTPQVDSNSMGHFEEHKEDANSELVSHNNSVLTEDLEKIKLNPATSLKADSSFGSYCDVKVVPNGEEMLLKDPKSILSFNHLQARSDENLNIQNVDDLNMGDLLASDEDLSENLYQDNNLFSEKVNHNFLKNLNKEISQEDVILADVDTDDNPIQDYQYFSQEESDKLKEEITDDIDFGSDEKYIDFQVPEISIPDPPKDFKHFETNIHFPGTFSPQNLAAKLLSSLNNKSQPISNDMFICDGNEGKNIFEEDKEESNDIGSEIDTGAE
jgi:hypothetical protein